MAFHLDHTTVHVCTTPAEILTLARAHKAHGGTIGEREERERRKAWIKEKILSGDLRPFSWATATIASEQFTQDVNGQHSTAVFLELTPEEWERVPFPITVIVEEYVCDGKLDFATLFEQFDDIRSARNNADKVGAHLGFYPELTQTLSRDVAVKVTAGMAWYRERVDGLRHLAERKFQLIHQNHGTHQFLQFAGSFLHTKKTSEMLRKPIIAALYRTYLAGTSTEEHFWKQISLGMAHLDADAPEGKLAAFLALLGSGKHPKWPAHYKRQFGEHHQPSDLDVFATCLRACMASSKHLKVDDIFLPAKKKTAAQLAQELWPLPAAQPAAAD